MFPLQRERRQMSCRDLKIPTIWRRYIVWWGGPHPYHGVLVWSDHIYRWHSPETDNQAFSPSPSSVVAVHGPAFWHTLFPSTVLLPQWDTESSETSDDDE